ncbi:MAG: SurA N-terminal domain-containing protein [Spirochaetia bacterium]|nr:SurA N-terminal domain-containing protein [Spirochaetia bacterium]
MKFTQKMMKAVSYTFMTALVIIIIWSFGMPDFMGQADSVNQFFVAKVGDEMITRKDIANYVDRNFSGSFQGQSIPPEFQKQLKTTALERLINQSVLENLYEKEGFFPIGDYQGSVIDEFLKKEFKEYVTAGEFNYEKFEKEFIKTGRLSFSQLKGLALKSLAFEAGQTLLLTEMSSRAALEAYDRERLNQTKISYKIVVIDAQKQNEIIKSKIEVSESDIKTKFKTDYLAKDPKAELTKIKREGIINTIINERKPEAEKSWKESLKQFSENETIENIARTNLVKTLEIKDVSLLQKLNAAKPKDAANLDPLQDSDELQNALFTAELGKVLGPWEKGGSQYFVVITDRKAPALKPTHEMIQEKKDIEEYFLENKANFEKAESEIKREKENRLINAMIKIERQNTEIRYFPAAEFKDASN